MHNDVSITPVFGYGWLTSNLRCCTPHNSTRLKAALTARSSKLMPDKVAFGYGFLCDGPGRGGTCDISAVGWILSCRLLDAEYHRLDHLLLALEAYNNDPD